MFLFINAHYFIKNPQAVTVEGPNDKSIERGSANRGPSPSRWSLHAGVQPAAGKTRVQSLDTLVNGRRLITIQKNPPNEH